MDCILLKPLIDLKFLVNFLLSASFGVLAAHFPLIRRCASKYVLIVMTWHFVPTCIMKSNKICHV